MTKSKTRVDQARVTEFLESISDDAQRTDSYTFVEMLRTATKAEPKMWRGTIVGFDSYHYVDKNGCEGDWLSIAHQTARGRQSASPEKATGCRAKTSEKTAASGSQEPGPAVKVEES
jgi:hypothetical protein